MPVCPKCSHENPEGTKFCENCGTDLGAAAVTDVNADANADVVAGAPEKTYEKIFCPNCGKETSAEFAFCQNCGAAITENALKAGAAEAAAPAAVKKSGGKKWILIGIIAVVVIAAAILLITLLGKGGGSRSGGKDAPPDFALYVKDKELFFTNFSKNGPIQATSKLLSDADMSSREISQSGYQLGEYTILSNDGKTLFFPDKYDDSATGVSMYYLTIGKKDADAVKIDSGVTTYSVSDDGRLFTYMKEGSLYQYDLKESEKEKLASDVYDYWISDDGQKVVYITDEEGMYLKEFGKDKEKLDSDVYNIRYTTKDFKTIYYLKVTGGSDSGDGYSAASSDYSYTPTTYALYKVTLGSDKEKLLSDVVDIFRIYDSGEIYYSKLDESSAVTLMDYVDDDMKAIDDSMEYPVEPEYPEYPEFPDYPYSWDYDDYDEYEAALEQYYNDYDAAYAAYQAAQDQYYADYDVYEDKLYDYYDKLDRDDMREELSDMTLDEPSYSLYYFDGKESTELTDSFVDYSDYNAYDAPVMIFKSYSQSEVSKVKLSEVYSIYDVEDMVESALHSSSEMYIAIKADTSVFEADDPYSIQMADDGSVVYFLDNMDDSYDHGDLFRVAITGGKPQKAEAYDTDVGWYIRLTDNNSIVYFKDYDEDKDCGELYIDKTRVDYDASSYALVYSADTNEIFYFTDYSDSASTGTLKVYKNGEAVKIADDVYDYELVAGNNLLFLSDYSTKSYSGDLYIYRKGAAEKLDTDVALIVPYYNYKYRGYTYGW